MKTTMAVAFLALALIPAGAQAHDRAHSKSEIKLLKDSAAALAPTDPVLSAKLKDYAAQGAGKKELAEGAQDEAAEQQDIQLLRDSASALKPSRPGLAKGLNRLADKEMKAEKRESSETHSEMPPAQQSPSGY
jgi:hypothetical protein